MLKRSPFMICQATGLPMSSGEFARDRSLWAPATEADTQMSTIGTIDGVFRRVCAHVVPDKELALRVIDFQMAFVNKNDDHIAFFGGVLTGVQRVIMTKTDMATFFSDVVRINEAELEEELHDLPSIVASRNISGDVFNHTCLWLCSIFLRDTKLPEALRRRAAQAAGLILNYRYLTSLLAWYYKFPADPEVAAAAYSRLTKKSLIKQFGSWHAVLEDRVEDFISKDGLHYNTLMKYQDDKKIVNALNDSQGRVRGMMKILMRELMEAASAGDRVSSVSATVEHDGEGFLRDKTKGLGTYTIYLKGIIADEHAFIKGEILGIVGELMYTTPPQMLMDTLQWCSKNTNTTKGKEIDDLVTMVIVHSFDYLANNRNVLRETNDIADLAVNLKGVYTSSRSTDPRLLAMRKLAEKIVVYATKTTNKNAAASVRTSLMLYLVMRAFSMNHYGTR